MSNRDDKIDRMHEAILEMRPMLADVREGQKAMDERMRAAEIRGTEHEIKIGRALSDLDGLGRKVRSVDARTLALGPAPRESGKMRQFLELIGALPVYWHVLGVASAGLLAAAAFVSKHRPEAHIP